MQWTDPGSALNGVFLLEVVAGATPPLKATLAIEKPSLDLDAAIAAADFRLTKDEAAGWKKLDSLDP